MNAYAVRKRMNNRVRLIETTVVVLSLCVWSFMPVLADAAAVYQWKDAAGHMHFTDNLGQVPPQYRQQGLKVRNIQSQDTKSSANRVPATISSGGKKIWETKCASCHFINGKGLREDGKRGLQRFVLNEKTGFPFNPEDILPRVRRAVAGRTSDMPPVNITDKELTLLINYLISTFK